MSILKNFAAAAALCLGTVPLAHAQNVALGTLSGAATGQIGIAIASVASSGGEIRVIPQETANTAQYIPLVDQGQLEFGIANYPQTYFAMTGTGLSEGQPADNLRLVASLMDFTSGMLVMDDSGIATLEDLAGRNVPRFPDNSLGDYVMRAVMATADLSYDDVRAVPTANFLSMYDGFRDGILDTSIATIGSAFVMDMQASVGEVRYLPMSEEDAPVMDEILPGTRIFDVSGSGEAAVTEDTKVFGYEYLLFANADVPDAVVTSMVRALHDGREDLLATSPMWQSFVPEGMARAGGMTYHPGALAFYQEHGIPVAE
ncbi:TAXI family TRAP transporter solute-binding subunit [Salipiger marinus]|uniref:TAXI family TRAP transporter solute-binding subunit n=1 Tax=Salipiger marinus TaxID=555512 RepID=UPI001E57474D|nr:TAXI family TRAP transporter solute-binding subunit [Salipiger manganoxidans]MCD1618872.1 TAXI family TRAP transporter solute-binding subunit [Salipiger manganoxidans]MEB3419783.1 TAXI family TRAP transporter solute-binding subunit [Salipiger manganoxidans]